MLEMKQTTTIPFVEEIQIVNQSLPLWYSHWGLFHKLAFDIRQHVSKSIENNGLDFLLYQIENTRRGVETLYGNLAYNNFVEESGLKGVDSWIKKLCSLINLKTLGAKPIETMNLVMTRQGYLAYYGKFYSDQMEIKLYIGSAEEIDGATVFQRARSSVDLSTRKWSALIEQLPLTVWVET